jgi:hypothetical protein
VSQRYIAALHAVSASIISMIQASTNRGERFSGTVRA